MKNSRLAERFQSLVRENANLIIGKPLDTLFSLGLQRAAHYTPLVTPKEDFNLDDSQKSIFDVLSSDGPGLVSRFGSTELRVLLKHKNRTQNTALQRAYKLLVNQEAPVWSPWEHRNIRTQSGFFPVNEETISKFAGEVIAAATQVDILGSWIPGENQFEDVLSNAVALPQPHLEPFFSKRPWTLALQGKKVLVVHPFSKTIEIQYAEKRDKLFRHPDLLPEFDLETVRAPQTLVQETGGYEDWFTALDDVTERCSEKDFDIALVACGAYGMPLGARLKKRGKRVMHLGGPLQLLFGIRGRRWDERSPYTSLFNEHWVRPERADHPPGYSTVDNGVYW